VSRDSPVHQTPLLSIVVYVVYVENSLQIKSNQIILEPTFTESSSETVTAELQALINAAVATIPPAHCITPIDGEQTKSRDVAFERLQNWAFTKGFALVRDSCRTEKGHIVRAYFDCVHHKKGTRNTCKLQEESRKRVETKTQANDCKFRLYVSYRKQQNAWVIRSINPSITMLLTLILFNTFNTETRSQAIRKPLSRPLHIAVLLATSSQLISLLKMASKLTESNSITVKIGW
jgi:hypothetical protein